MKRQRMISEGALKRLNQSALEAWNRQDYPVYFRIMEQAGRQDPANAGLLLDLGTAYGLRYDYAAAERCFEKAIRVAPSKSNLLIMAGTQCRSFYRFDLARSYFERAINEPRASADTFVKLAEIYERFHQLEKASAMVERALHMNPAGALATLVAARLDRLSGRLEEAERRLRPLLSKSDPETWSTRIRGWYEMGAVLDAQSRYDEAMTALLEAKSMILPNATQYIAGQKQVHARLTIVAQNLTTEKFARWKSQGSDFQPPCRLALLCGHPRSGTTLLEQVLDSHPEFVSAEETSIFNRESFESLLGGLPTGAMLHDVLEAASVEALRRARRNYAECMTKFFSQPQGAKMLIDKNPSLTGLVPAFVRIFPEAKLLVALRDPRDVCLSCFMQPLPLGKGSAIFLTLEGTVQEYVSIMGLWRSAACCLERDYLEVRYEDLVADLESVSRRALEFLGTAWDEKVLRFDEHARGKLVRSPTYAAVAKPISKGAIGRWRNYQKHLAPYLDTLAPLLKAFGYE
jgi:tetratricopeptide (TPR) repeat protein